MKPLQPVHPKEGSRTEVCQPTVTQVQLGQLPEVEGEGGHGQEDLLPQVGERPRLDGGDGVGRQPQHHQAQGVGEEVGGYSGQPVP